VEVAVSERRMRLYGCNSAAWWNHLLGGGNWERICRSEVASRQESSEYVSCVLFCTSTLRGIWFVPV